MIGKLVTTLFIQLALINGELDFAVHIQGITIYHYFYSNLETTCTSGGKDAADKLADRHGMVNMGEIIPETGFYLLRTRENNRRRRSVRDLSGVFSAEPEVDWAQFQGANIRCRL